MNKPCVWRIGYIGGIGISVFVLHLIPINAALSIITLYILIQGTIDLYNQVKKKEKKWKNTTDWDS